MRRIVLVVLVCVVAGVSVGVEENGAARGGPVSDLVSSVPASVAANGATAQTDASWLLTQVPLPAGATRSESEPAGDEGQLAHPGIGSPVTPNIVDDHAWWVLPGARSEALAYLRAHPPAGSTIALSGSAGTYGTTTSESIAFAWPPITGALGMRWLGIIVTQLPSGQTGLRADAQVVWITPRSASEIIPTGARVLRVSVHSGIAANQPDQRPLRFTSAQKIARVIALLNSLPAAQPGTRSCPADFGITIRLAFYPTPHARPSAVVQIDPQGCGEVRLTLHGTPQPALAGEPPTAPGYPSTESLTQRIDRMLGTELRVRPRR